MGLDDDDAFDGVPLVLVCLALVVAAVLVATAALPFRLVAAGLMFFGAWAGLSWLLVKRLPEKPLAFWPAFGLDTALGAWLLVTFVALCRAGWWARLGAWGDRLGHPDTCSPDTALAVIGVCVIGWQALRVMEEAPQAARMPGWVRLDWLFAGFKIALLFGFAGFLMNGGDRWLKSLFE
jgi:hypothetical protein